MCSVNEIEQASDTLKSKKTPKRQRNVKHFADEGSCMKCPEKAVVLIRNNDPFCKNCFLDCVVHKFRATIGKARVIYQGQKVLVAVSGGASSCAMLDLVIKGLGKAAVKKHRFQPGVVHIDDEGLCGQSVDDRNSVKHHIEELLRSVGFPCHHVSLADLFLQQNKEEACLAENLEQLDTSSEISKSRNRLTELFRNVSTATSKEDLLSRLYHKQLQKVAKDHGYDYIMIGDCGTNLAIRILADVAQGRGSQLPFNVAFKDDRSDVPVLRPMREFTKKDIQFYNCFSKVTSFTAPSFATKASTHSSMNRLTEELIFGLQSKFPSTVNTVLKTGDKICSNVDSTESEHCSLCFAPLDITSGFSDVADELTTCGSGECGSGCQESGGGGVYTSDSGSDAGTLKDKGGIDGHDGTLKDKGGIDGHDGTLKDEGGIDGHDGTLKDKGGIDGHDGTSRGTSGHCSTLGSCGSTLRDTGGTDEDDGALRSDSQAGTVNSTAGEISSGTSAGNDSGFSSAGTSGDVCTTTSHDSTVAGSCCYDSKDGQHHGGDTTCLTTKEEKTDDGGTMVPDAHSDQTTGDHSILLANTLCYGCRLTYHDIKDGQTLLPKFVTENSNKQFQRRAMKGQIKDFLLDD